MTRKCKVCGLSGEVDRGRVHPVWCKRCLYASRYVAGGLQYGAEATAAEWGAKRRADAMRKGEKR